MANSSDSAATGGFLVIIGIVVALAIAFFLFRGQVFDRSGPDINVDLPDTKVEVPSTR